MHLSLTAKAYGAAGQADSAGHAMAILKVHQVKALKELHEDSSEPGLRQELCSAIDFVLRAAKVMARALSQTMSTMVILESHHWLNPAEIREFNKVRFLDAAYLTRWPLR